MLTGPASSRAHAPLRVRTGRTDRRESGPSLVCGIDLVWSIRYRYGPVTEQPVGLDAATPRTTTASSRSRPRTRCSRRPRSTGTRTRPSSGSTPACPLVIDRREEYFICDMSGKRLIDVHLNGGTYNLGHRNPEVVQALTVAMQHFDIGNHHFPALARTALAEALIASAPEGPVEGRSTAPAAARRSTSRSRRRGTPRRSARSCRSSRPTTATPAWPSAPATTGSPSSSCPTSPRTSRTCRSTTCDAMEDALRGRDVAAVIMETIPATYGFPLPDPGYLRAVKALCEKYDALYIADEVQTGLDAHRRAVGHHQGGHRARHHGDAARASPAACTRSRACW